MSRVTAGIFRIKSELDKISGLDGVVADRIEELEIRVKEMVKAILKDNPESNVFDYYGKGTCKHCLGYPYKNEIGELMCYCELTGNAENVTLGECLGNCEAQQE